MAQSLRDVVLSGVVPGAAVISVVVLIGAILLLNGVLLSYFVLRGAVCPACAIFGEKAHRCSDRSSRITYLRHRSLRCRPQLCPPQRRHPQQRHPQRRRSACAVLRVKVHRCTDSLKCGYRIVVFCCRVCWQRGRKGILRQAMVDCDVVHSEDGAAMVEVSVHGRRRNPT